jgi:hypothetical protein
VSGSRGGRNGRDYLSLPETDSRHLRLRLLESAGPEGYGLAEVAVQPLDLEALAVQHARNVLEGMLVKREGGR